MNAARPAPLGLIVLQVDETIELEFRRIFAGHGQPLFVSRVPSGAELTPDTIAQMGQDLPRAASLLPQSGTYAAVGYACTSGTTLLGRDRVARLVTEAVTTRRVCDPLHGAIEMMAAHDVRRIGLVSPYIALVAAPVQQAFEAAGFEVAHALHFGEVVEAKVARIPDQVISEAAQSVSDGVDAVFLSCTNLRTLDLLEPLRGQLGVPVLSSNLCLAWQMTQHLDVTFPLIAGVSAGFKSNPA